MIGSMKAQHSTALSSCKICPWSIAIQQSWNLNSWWGGFWELAQTQVVAALRIPPRCIFFLRNLLTLQISGLAVQCPRRRQLLTARLVTFSKGRATFGFKPICWTPWIPWFILWSPQILVPTRNKRCSNSMEKDSSFLPSTCSPVHTARQKRS